MSSGKTSAASAGGGQQITGTYIKNSTRPATLYYSNGEELLEAQINSTGSGDSGDSYEIPVLANSIIAVVYGGGSTAAPPVSGGISLILQIRGSSGQSANLYFVGSDFTINWQ